MARRFQIRTTAVVCLTAIAAFLAILAFQHVLRLTGNFHTVVSGEFYRSSQLSPAALEGYIKRYGIKSVVNLRGAAPDAAWYREEKAVAASLGVGLIDFGMSATHPLPPARAAELVAVLREAPRPILVHCLDGADRTGLVSVIYASQIAGQDEEEAETQLSTYYGHFGIPLLSPTRAMDSSWEALEPFFGISGS
jgi:protein tyrosine/serine phosphatase